MIREPDDGFAYSERPRVTRHDVSGSTQTVHFSWPLDASSGDAERVALFEHGESVCISGVQLGDDGRELAIRTGRTLEADALDLCFDPLPSGTDGEKATYWAATLGCR